MSELITVEQLKRVSPKSIKDRIDDSIVDTINNIAGDEQFREHFRDNLLSYTGVLQDGRYKIQSYIDACRYVSHKLMGCSNIAAYTKTFPERFQRLVDEGASDKDISSYVTAYNKTQLVNKIFEQTLVPTYVLNADLYQRAINVQADLMLSANSEKVRSDAANSLLTHLKRPETTKIELDVGIKEDKSIQELRETTKALVEQQKKMLESRFTTAKDIAHSKLIEVEVINED